MVFWQITLQFDAKIKRVMTMVSVIYVYDHTCFLIIINKKKTLIFHFFAKQTKKLIDEKTNLRIQYWCKAKSNK